MDFEVVKALLQDCIYLEDTSVTIFGYKIHGTPWTKFHYGNAFQRQEEVLIEKWKLIPDDTDILISHSPPFGHGDEIAKVKGMKVGCPYLLDEVLNRVKPMYHLFGHIHEGYGVTT